MTGAQLLNFLSKLSKSELKKEVTYMSEDLHISGVVKGVKKQPFDLLWDGEDDPSELKSRNFFEKQYGMDKEELDSLTVEIAKGDIVITF